MLNNTPAIYTVLSILSLLRNGYSTSDLWRGFRKRGMTLHPRLRFWLPLLQKATLLNKNFVPTGFARQWFSWPPFDQSLHLLESWQTAPANRAMRAERKNLLRRLTRNAAITVKDQRELPGLCALDICHEDQLSGWGKVVLGLAACPNPAQTQPWCVEGDLLYLPHTPGWRRVWELEHFLQPGTPYEYSLTPSALRLVSQRGDPQTLLQTLKAGLCAPVPPALTAQILGQPVIQCNEGIILTFSAPEELRQLRQSATLRPYLARILTPRSILVDPSSAPRLLRLFERRGIYARPSQEEPAEIHVPLPPAPKWPTPQTRADLMQALTYHIQTQTGLDILYNAPNAERPENRHITPLLIEPQGEYIYVIAYCHRVRAQRTFRLDRMELP